MSGSRQRTNPVGAALVRLADLAGRGVRPARMEREVEAIVAGWAGGASPADADEVAERLAEFREQLAAGVGDAAEQLADVDRSDAGAVRHAGLVHAALVGALEAIERARDTQRSAPAAMALAPAPDLPAATRDDPLAAQALAAAPAATAAATAAGDAVADALLPAWTPQAADPCPAGDGRPDSEPGPAPASAESPHARTRALKTRGRSRTKEKVLHARA